MILKIDRTNLQPEVIALNALAFIAEEHERLGDFMAETGLDGSELRERAGDPLMLGAVLDHLLNHETLLLAFAEAGKCRPEDVVRARQAFPGASHDS